MSPQFPAAQPIYDENAGFIETPKTSTQADDKFTQNYYLQKLSLVYGHKSNSS
jgi:hypothetical protein